MKSELLEFLTEKNILERENKGFSKKLGKLMEETVLIKKKKRFEEKKRERIKLALQVRQEFYSELENAAIVIQKHARGYIARKGFVVKMIEKYEFDNYLLRLDQEIADFCSGYEKVQHMAAYRIQRYWKGFRKYRVNIGVSQRILKMLMVKREIQGKIWKIQGVRKVFQWLDQRALKEYWGNMKSYQLPESIVLSETESIESEKSENIVSEKSGSFVSEKSEIQEKKYKVLELPLKPIEPQMKLFILSEKNFAKPTISSKYRKLDYSPESRPLSVPKITRKSKTRPVAKRLLKQTTSRTSYISELSKENTKKSTELVKLPIPCEMPPKPTKKYSAVQSKFKDFRIKTAIRSTSYIPNRKIIEEKEEIQMAEYKTLHPTLEFKEALPDLYNFVENYKQTIKKNEAIVSTSGLIIIPHSKKINY